MGSYSLPPVTLLIQRYPHRTPPGRDKPIFITSFSTLSPQYFQTIVQVPQPAAPYFLGHDD